MVKELKLLSQMESCIPNLKVTRNSVRFHDFNARTICLRAKYLQSGLLSKPEKQGKFSKCLGLFAESTFYGQTGGPEVSRCRHC